MVSLTKNARQVFSGFDASNAPRQVSNTDAVTWGAEIEKFLDATYLGNIASGGIAGRATYDTEDAGFLYLETDRGDGHWYIHVKDSATSGDWSSNPLKVGATNGVDGADGKTGGAFTYTFDGASQVMADPGPGKFRLNNATPTSATAIAVAADLLDATDVSALLVSAHADSCRIIITSGTKRLEFDSNILTDNTDWLQFGVSDGVAVGTLADGDACDVVIVANSSTDRQAAVAAAAQATIVAGDAETFADLAEAAATSIRRPQDWGTFQQDWRDGANVNVMLRELGAQVYWDGTAFRLSAYGHADAKRLVKFGEGYTGLSWLDAYDNVTWVDYQNGVVMIRSATAANCWIGTLAEAVAQKGFVDLTGGDYMTPVSAISGWTDGGSFTVVSDADSPSGSLAPIFTFSSGTTGSPLAFLRQRSFATDNIDAQMLGGANPGGVQSTAADLASAHTSGVRFAQNNMVVFVDGTQRAIGATPPSGTDTLCDVPTGLTRFYNRRQGDGGVTNRNTAAVRWIAVIPQALDNTQLQAATA